MSIDIGSEFFENGIYINQCGIDAQGLAFSVRVENVTSVCVSGKYSNCTSIRLYRAAKSLGFISVPNELLGGLTAKFKELGVYQESEPVELGMVY